MTEAVVELVSVSRTYPGPPAVQALHPSSLTVFPGEYLAVEGPSGSGKSTLLNLLGLLDRPTTGTLRIDGIDTARLKERDRTALRARRISFVFQAFHLLPYRTATENVALAQIYTGVRPRTRTAVAREALCRVGLSHRLDAMPTTLSGGERQRVAIARSLVNNPSLLLCDEPTGNLDSQTSAHVLDVLEMLNDDGVTIVVITHQPEVARRADRIISIRDGQIADA